MTDQNHKKTLVFISAFLHSAKKAAKKAGVRISNCDIKKNPCCDQYEIVKDKRIVWGGFAYNADEALGDYIFQEIHAREKSIARFDGLEISPVAEFAGNGASYFERVDNPKEAHFWSFYGHLKTGGVECIEDFDIAVDAITSANHLLALYPNLREYSLLQYANSLLKNVDTSDLVMCDDI